MSRSINKPQRIVVAMSGGVDSSVAALLLLRHGYQVLGATLDTGYGQAGAQAAQVCSQLGIEHRIIDAREEFSQRVVEDFIATYSKGETPNPCVECNAALKFPSFWPLMEEVGAQYLATGHYARVLRQAGREALFRGADPAKDQSYFLYRLDQFTLSRCLFPLGEYTKEQARALAAQAGLNSAHQKDSYDICFIPGGDYRQLLAERCPQCFIAGDILDQEGRVVGRHQGLANYTLGQRRGVNVALGYPAYVVKLDTANNQVVVGEKTQLFSGAASCCRCNFLPWDELPGPTRIQALVRYRARPALAWLEPAGEGRALIFFDQPEWGLAPGQSAVFYQGDELIGGGVICD